MQVYETSAIRNVALVAHGSAGKTSLTEAMLYNSGYLKRMGKVEDGSTISDYLPEEIARQVTTTTALASVEWNKHKINVLDTPGYADFFGEVISSVAAVDSLVVVVCGVAGIEVQTQVIWDYAAERNIPRMIFVNKLDREFSCQETVGDMVRGQFGSSVVPIQIAIGKEQDGDTYRGYIDIITNKAYLFDAQGTVSETEVPEYLADMVHEYHNYFVEATAETDDELLMRFLDDDDRIPLDDLVVAFKKAVAAGKLYPLVGGSAVNNYGINAMMDAIVNYMPAPDTVARENIATDKAQAFVFKTLADPFVGKLSFLRVFNGPFQAGDGLYNVNTESEEKINQFLVLRGKAQETVAAANTGDIVAVAKLQHTLTGHTLTNKKQQVPLIDPIVFPAANYTVAVTVKSRGDEDKMSNALARLIEEDPTLHFEKNAETKDLLLYGLGDVQLDIVAERFKNKFGVDVLLHAPRIPYRETIKKSVKVQGRHKKQSGGAGQFGDVWLEISPYPEGDFLFEEHVFGGAVPRNYFPAVEKGVQDAMGQGIVAGYPVTNIKVNLYDGSYHPVDSNEMSFRLAGALAFRNGMEQAGPVLLEPIVNLRITVPEQYMGDIMGDMTSKRGKIIGMTAEGKNQVIEAQAPLSELSRYVIDLKAMTQGRGNYLVTPSHYEEVPARLAEAIIAAHKAEQ